MSPGELDSLLERAAELPSVDKLPTDPVMLRRWAEDACGMVLELRQALANRVGMHGGTLAMRLREALEDKVVAKLNGRAVLTPETEELSLGVHLLPEGVVIDARLRVGKVRNEIEKHSGQST